MGPNQIAFVVVIVVGDGFAHVPNVARGVLGKPKIGGFGDFALFEDLLANHPADQAGDHLGILQDAGDDDLGTLRTFIHIGADGPAGQGEKGMADV